MEYQSDSILTRISLEELMVSQEMKSTWKNKLSYLTQVRLFKIIIVLGGPVFRPNEEKHYDET